MAEESAPAPAAMPVLCKKDLIHTLSRYLDLHLMFPLLEFLELKESGYSEGEVLSARIALLEPTNMVDYAMEVYAQLHGGTVEDAPKAMETRRDAVLDTLDAQEAETATLREFFADEATIADLQANGKFNPEYLEQHHGISTEMLNGYYKFAKFQYECGDYETAREMLSNYLNLTQSATSTPMGFNALWGKFACEILLKNWENALVEMNNVKVAIEERGCPPLEQLQQRSWLLHWSLFVFFNHQKGRDGIVDFFFQEKYLQAIQTNCPWLLRYLTTAVIINKRRRNVLKDLVRVIQQEQYTYADPITQFVECLYLHFDFEGAQQKLRDCEKVLQSDYFLCNCSENFMEDARLFIFETYCRIHQKIDISMLAHKLAMEPEDAERWIVDLIRGALLDAKIDSQDNHVIMGNTFPSVYQQVIDKTADLTERSAMLASNLKRVLADGDGGAPAQQRRGPRDS